MKPIIFIFIILFFLGVNYYVFLRIWQMIPFGSIGRILLLIGAGIVLSSFFVYIFASNVLPTSLNVVIYKIGTSWFFIMLYLLIALLLLDIIKLLKIFPMESVMKGNWATLGILAGSMVVIFLAGYLNYQRKDRIELNIEITKGSGREKHIKVLTISDLHLGYGIDKKELGRWIKIINAEKPDIVLIAGDLIDSDVRPLEEQRFWELFKDIHAPQGIFMVPGNHEYISGIKKSVEFIDKTGVILLKDTITLVNNGVYIVGRDDKANPHRKSISELIEGIDKSKPIIMLDHQPYNLEEAENNNIDLQVSGHTHRGQIWPISWITDTMYEDSHGYLKKGDTHYFVSQGIGIWGGKFRIGTRSDYGVINIRFKDN